MPGLAATGVAQNGKAKKGYKRLYKRLKGTAPTEAIGCIIALGQQGPNGNRGLRLYLKKQDVFAVYVVELLAGGL